MLLGVGWVYVKEYEKKKAKLKACEISLRVRMTWPTEAKGVTRRASDGTEVSG